MVLVVVLLGVWFSFILEEKFADAPRLKSGQSALFALAAMYAVAGVSHFVQTADFADMVPLPASFKTPVVYASGVFLLAAAAGLLYPPTLRLSAIALAVFLVAVLPAHFYAAYHFQGVGGHESGPVYLLVRLPMQLFFFWWTVRFGVLAPPGLSKKKQA